MRRFYVAFLSLMCAGLSLLSAQTVPDLEKHRMNIAVLELLHKYEKLAEMSTLGQVSEFTSLFRSPDTPVYNDFIGVSDLEKMPARDYASFLYGMRDVDVAVRNVRKSKPYVYAGSLCVDVTFEKSVSYYDKRNVWYSSDQAYGEPYVLKFVVSYDDFDGTCRIESVEGRLESDRRLGTDHVVLKKSANGNLTGLRFSDADSSNGRYRQSDESYVVDFGEQGFACLPASAKVEDWYYMQDMPETMDPDCFIRSSVTSDGFLVLSRKMKNFRAKVYDAATIAGAFVIGGELDKKFSFTNETGVDFRYLFNVGKKVNIGAYAGVGVAYDYLDVAIKDFSYEYEFNKKPRKYDIGIMGQKYMMLDGVLSGGAAFEFAISKRVTLNVDLGGKAYFNLMTQHQNIYADYNLTYSDKVVNVRGFFKTENILNKAQLKPDIWPCPISAVAGLGCSINMTKYALLNVGLKYEHGLNYYYQSPLNSYKGYEMPVKASYLTGIDVVLYDFADSFTLKRRALVLDLGFVFKF